MTVASDINKAGPYSTNGVTTVFAYGFLIFDESHLSVFKTDISDGSEVTLVLDSDYTVTGVDEPTGGDVIIDPALAAGFDITILRIVPQTQETDLSNQGSWLPEVHERVFDRLTMMVQDLQEQSDRSVKVGVNEEAPDDYLLEVQNATAAAETAQAGAEAAETGAVAAQVAAETAETGAVAAEAGAVAAQAAAEAANQTFSKWLDIDSGSYDPTPTTTSRIEMSDTTAFTYGGGIRYKDSRGYRFGIIIGVSVDDWITIMGAAFDTGDDLTELAAIPMSLVTRVRYEIPGNFGFELSNSLLEIAKQSFDKYALGVSKCVGFYLNQAVPDSGAEAIIQFLANGNNLSTANGGKGIQLVSADNWVDSGVTVDVTNYQVAQSTKLEVKCGQAGGVGDAEGLSVIAVFVPLA